MFDLSCCLESSHKVFMCITISLVLMTNMQSYLRARTILKIAFNWFHNINMICCFKYLGYSNFYLEVGLCISHVPLRALAIYIFFWQPVIKVHKCFCDPRLKFFLTKIAKRFNMLSFFLSSKCMIGLWYCS